LLAFLPVFAAAPECLLRDRSERIHLGLLSRGSSVTVISRHNTAVARFAHGLTLELVEAAFYRQRIRTLTPAGLLLFGKGEKIPQQFNLRGKLPANLGINQPKAGALLLSLGNAGAERFECGPIAVYLLEWRDPNFRTAPHARAVVVGLKSHHLWGHRLRNIRGLSGRYRSGKDDHCGQT
jgi:hypothetical protein